MTNKIAIKPFEQEPRKSFTPKQRAELFLKFDGLCYKCGCKITGGGDIEHIKPLSLGGTNDFENLNIICKPCHKLKTKQDIQDLIEPRRLNKKHSQPKKEGSIKSVGKFPKGVKLRSKGFSSKIKKKPYKQM